MDIPSTVEKSADVSGTTEGALPASASVHPKEDSRGRADAVADEVPLITSATRIPALDGLRGIAILLVLVWHVLYQLHDNPGIFYYPVMAGRLMWSGVDLFFVLSGFLIGGILLDATSSPRYFTTFYARRAFRILPIYAVLVGLCSVRFLPSQWMPASLGNLSASDLPWASYLTFTQNLWMAGRGVGGIGTLSPTWSLAIEEHFYQLVPLIIRKTPRARLTILLLAFVVGAPLLRIALLHCYRYGAMAAVVLMPCRADGLSLGVLSALLVRDRRSWDFVVARRSTLWKAAAVLFVGVGVLTYEAGRAGLNETVTFSWLALFYTCGLLLALSGREGLMQRVLTARPLMWLGGVAYFMYLFHLPVIEVFRRMISRHAARPNDPAVVIFIYLLGLAVTLVLAEISWRFFENPMIRRGRSFTY